MSLVVREAPRCVLPQGGRHVRETQREEPSSIAVWARYGPLRLLCGLAMATVGARWARFSRC